MWWKECFASDVGVFLFFFLIYARKERIYPILKYRIKSASHLVVNWPVHEVPHGVGSFERRSRFLGRDAVALGFSVGLLFGLAALGVLGVHWSEEDGGDATGE